MKKILDWLKIVLSILTLGMYKYKKEPAKGPYDDIIFVSQNRIEWNEFADEVFRLVNVFRKGQGRPLLVKDDNHYRVAGARAYFFSQVLGEMKGHTGFPEYALRLQKMGAKSVAENLSWKYGTPKGVVEGWKRSKGEDVIDNNGNKVHKNGHRDILLGDYFYAGVGFEPNPNAICLMLSKLKNVKSE